MARARPSVSAAADRPSFPNFAGKHASAPVFTAAEAVGRLGRQADGELPAGIVITYQHRLIEHLQALGAECRGGFPSPWRKLWSLTPPGGEPVGIVNGFGVGAPAATIVLEELIALGARRVVNMGTAGCLQSGLSFGEVVLCDAAIRDDGVSHHYLPSARLAHPDASLTGQLQAELSRRGVPFATGPTWTTDAPFRETIAEARAYQTEGVLTVEMEAAALFAVGEVHGVDVAAAFIVSDLVLPDTAWVSEFDGNAVRASSVALLDSAISVLATPPC